ncbi:tonB-dependent receptor family protein [Asticcacaulis biprosthecium C19]|uniref:TonB-dependent receptor family protein n=1 Tax=Asticcacaulis biprosthecium C19 TaxID=715226 RepID=F4QN17_9CAUL|nr:TonB-dependent receptor [Asticcacaulis biprosthecium]EGF91608.1 tonB-dependent receptor family protein [Asticcacaulis biprosthecium C19]
MKISKGKGLAGLMLKGGVSVLALTAFAAVAAPVAAQDAPAADAGDAVVVVGVRRSLKSAQQIKRDADTVVDSITANDIGSFPDKSVAEALQRVAGITVNRFAAASDTAHFSAEPSGVLVRGLNQVRSEFNGRDTFSANSSRGLSWGDVSPELMAGVDTYKNQTAELIEGGIAGSINLRTRVPFDSKGRLMALSADIGYGDLAEKATGEFSGIYSDRWTIDGGEVGVMLNFAHSDVATTSQGIQLGRMGIFCASRYSLTDVSTCKTNQFGQNNADTQHNFAYIPVSSAYRDNNYDRTRDGLAFAAQWQDADRTKLATLQFNTSTYTNEWHERVVQGSYFDLWAQPLGYQVTNGTAMAELDANNQFTFTDEGLFQSGLITSDIGWWGGDNAGSAQVAKNSAGTQMVNACYGWNGCSPARRGTGLGTATRYSINEQTTSDLSFNFKWDVNDRLKTNFDIQYVKASVENYDIEVDINSYANINLDMTGDYPVMDLRKPLNVNQISNAPNNAWNGLSNPNSYYYNAVMDHTEDSEGTEFATRFDVQYSMDGWLETIKAGVRYANREQDVNWSTYNWKNISNTYSNNAATWNIDTSARPGGSSLYNISEFGTELLHGENLVTGANQFAFFNFDILEDRAALSKAMSQASTGIGVWTPICDRPNEVANSCYTPAEIMAIGEKTSAIYVQAKFGGDHTIFGFDYSGNIGVRYVETQITSKGGGVQFPNGFEYAANNCDVGLTQLQIDQALAAGQFAVAPNCVTNHSVDDVTFRDGAITSDPQFPAIAKNKLGNFLPSFNIKVNLTDQWLVRFAASRAMSRPDMGLLRNFFFVQGSTLTQQELVAGNPNIVYGTGVNLPNGDPQPNRRVNCPVGQPCSYNGYRYTASSGNPYLKPTTADQFDVTAEYYFGSVGSLTFNLFYKQFHDYIQNGTRSVVTLTHNGVTRDVLQTGPVNGEGASIKGYEIAYTRFFDFLPAPFDGLGIQANYTHLKNTGIKNAGLSSTTAGGLGTGGGGVNAQFDSITVDRLESLSDDAYNVVLMYEKGPLAMRAAYNWRSEYLVTAADCCVGYPIWQDAAGFLDASIRYRVNDNIELNIQGQNLLNTDTVLMQQVDNRGTKLPNAWFQNDKRIQAGFRLKY